MNEIRRCINLLETVERQDQLDEGVTDTLSAIYNKFKNKIVGTKSTSDVPKFVGEFKWFLSPYVYEAPDYSYEYTVHRNDIEHFKKEASEFGLKQIDNYSQVYTMPIFSFESTVSGTQFSQQYITVILSAEPDAHGEYKLLFKWTNEQVVTDTELLNRLNSRHNERLKKHKSLHKKLTKRK